MEREIRVKHGTTIKIARELGCSRIHVAASLKGIVNSDLSNAIRGRAIELGGIKVKK